MNESSQGNAQQIKVINNFARTLKSRFIKHLLIKSAFVSRGWMIASAVHRFGVKQCALRHKAEVGTEPETYSRPNEFSCLLLSALCGFIIVTLLMRTVCVKEINTTSLHSRGCHSLSYSLCLSRVSSSHPATLSFSLIKSLLLDLILSICLFPRGVYFTPSPLSADMVI